MNEPQQNHQSNLQALAIEICRVLSNIAAEIMKHVFEIKNHKYNFQRDVRLQCRNVNTVLYGILKIWNLVPRSSRPEVFCKKGVLRNSAKFTEHLCQSL